MIITEQTHIYSLAECDYEFSGLSDQELTELKYILIRDSRDTKDIPYDELMEYVDEAIEQTNLTREMWT